ncbi:unnamed protein product [Caenorhabditis nigoni]
MTSLSNIYNKNATLKNGGILAFIATASAENQQLEYPQDSIPYLEMVVIVSIILAICYIIYAVCALWTLRQYLRAHVVHSQQWKTFVEFPVIHHACHVIRKFYSVSLTALVINFTIKLFNFTSFSQGPFKVFSIAYIPSILQLPEVFLTLCIMSMTLVGCKKKEQVSTSANLCKVGPLPVAGDIENPPIQNSY